MQLYEVYSDKYPLHMRLHENNTQEMHLWAIQHRIFDARLHSRTRGAQATVRAQFVQVGTYAQRKLEPVACSSGRAFSSGILVGRCVWHHVDIAYIHRQTALRRRRWQEKGSIGMQATVWQIATTLRVHTR